MKHKHKNFSDSLWLPLLLFTATATLAQSVWTNAAGRAFTARLETLTDTHATFVMADGVTNVLSLSALDAACQTTARRVRQLPEIPDILRATFDQCSRDLRRVRFLHEDARLDNAAYADARRKLLAGFRVMFDKHDLPAESYPALERRLLNASNLPTEESGSKKKP